MFDHFLDYMNGHPLRWLGWYLVLSLAFIIGMAVAAAAEAGEGELTWTQPTHNVDGSAIPATGVGRLVGNRVEWGSCAGTPWQAA